MDEKSDAKIHYIKTLSGKVVAQSIAFRAVSIYTVSQKNVPPLELAIIFTYTVRLRQFLAQMLLSK